MKGKTISFKCNQGGRVIIINVDFKRLNFFEKNKILTIILE